MTESELKTIENDLETVREIIDFKNLSTIFNELKKDLLGSISIITGAIMNKRENILKEELTHIEYKLFMIQGICLKVQNICNKHIHDKLFKSTVKLIIDPVCLLVQRFNELLEIIKEEPEHFLSLIEHFELPVSSLVDIVGE